MKYMGMPMGMWALFAGSFQKQLTAVFGYDADAAQAITKKAKPKYKAIIADLPEFEKADRFKMNIVNCAMLGAFILSMPERPKVDRLTDYYAKSMMTKPMKWFCRKSGKKKFTEKDIAGMQATAALKAADRKVTQSGYPEDHLDNLYSHQDCIVTGWAQTSVLSHQCDTLPGDSGSPLLLKTEDGWQVIAVQSSAPGPQDRWRADNRAIAVTGFRDKLEALAGE